MPPSFQGTAWALSSDGLATAAGNLGVYAPKICTVLAVETSGCGYLLDRRPLPAGCDWCGCSDECGLAS